MTHAARKPINCVKTQKLVLIKMHGVDLSVAAHYRPKLSVHRITSVWQLQRQLTRAAWVWIKSVKRHTLVFLCMIGLQMTVVAPLV